MNRFRKQAGQSDLTVALAVMLLSIFGLHSSLMQIPTAKQSSKTIELPILLGVNFARLERGGECLFEFPVVLKRDSSISLAGSYKSATEEQQLTIDLTSNMLSQINLMRLSFESGERERLELRASSINPVSLQIVKDENHSAKLSLRFEGPITAQISEFGRLSIALPRNSAETIESVWRYLREQLTVHNLTLTFSKRSNEESCQRVDPHTLPLLVESIVSALDSHNEIGKRT